MESDYEEQDVKEAAQRLAESHLEEEEEEEARITAGYLAPETPDLGAEGERDAEEAAAAAGGEYEEEDGGIDPEAEVAAWCGRGLRSQCCRF